MHFFWKISAILFLSGCSFGSPSKEQAEIRMQVAKYKKANPTSDLQKAWVKGDFRFIGIYGFTLDTPGVPRGKDGGWIHLVGINPVQGTSDAIRFNEQMTLVNIASDYAKSYNLALFQKLKSSRSSDPRIIRLFEHLEEEIQLLEKSNPKIDLDRNISKKDLAFIYLQETGIEGASDRNFDNIPDYQLKIRKLRSSKDLLNKSQYQRYRRVAVNYVGPYNKMLFDYLMKRNKKQQK